MSHAFNPLLLQPAFRAYAVSAVLARLAQSSLTILLGFHLYQLTRDPLTLAWMGLAQALPAIGLVLYGGHIADRHSRWTMTLIARGCYVVLALLIALGAFELTLSLVPTIYLVSFGLGCVGAFASPAVAGLEAEVVPQAQAMRAVSVLGSISQAAGLVGPVAGGVLFELAGPGATYAVIGCLFAASSLVVFLFVPNAAAPPRTPGDGAIARIAEGIRMVFADQVLIGSMALDLFAVFFGGAAALLPIFATEILHVGPTGFAFMRAAISVGSLLAMLVAVRHPPREHAGFALHVAIAGFGLFIIVFALSRNYFLSLFALMMVGACDGVSMVVRQAILRLVVPGPLRGRISAVRSVFINSSNELGDFESGVLAKFAGAVPAVWIGGVVTLAVVAVTAWRAPRLRQLDLAALERDGAELVKI